MVKAGEGEKFSNLVGGGSVDNEKADTILSSDNESIAVPKGYVTVAVEGEAAVKAIVK